MIDRQILLARKADLEDGLKRLQADAYATSGAIQEVEHWLSVLDEEGAGDEPAPLSLEVSHDDHNS